MFPVDYWKRMISVLIIGLLQWIYYRGFMATANTVFVEYILLVEKRLKAYLIHLCYFVYLSEE